MYITWYNIRWDKNLFSPLQDDLCTLPNAKFLGKSMFKTSFLHPSENGRLQKDILMPPSTGALRKRPGMLQKSNVWHLVPLSQELIPRSPSSCICAHTYELCIQWGLFFNRLVIMAAWRGPSDFYVSSSSARTAATHDREIPLAHWPRTAAAKVIIRARHCKIFVLLC